LGFKIKRNKSDAVTLFNPKRISKNNFMKSKRYISLCLIILLTGVICFPLEAQQKNNPHHANFSGEWKSKEPISIG
jgi:hypothetical protein